MEHIMPAGENTLTASEKSKVGNFYSMGKALKDGTNMVPIL